MFQKLTGFEWDEGNATKNWIKHKVSHLESEQIFFNKPLIVQDDLAHSKSEERWFALGKTDKDRRLMTVFTVRKDKIRIISSRDMSRKERNIYEKEA